MSKKDRYAPQTSAKAAAGWVGDAIMELQAFVAEAEEGEPNTDHLSDAEDLIDTAREELGTGDGG